MEKFCYLSIFFLLFTSQLKAQTRLTVGKNSFGCNYVEKPSATSVFGFKTNSEAEQAIDQILSLFGLEPTFKIYAAAVDGAYADIVDEERVIVYDQNFMQDVETSTGSRWAPISILAHEVAHHVQGHTIKAGGSQPELELQADKWSGFVMYKLGASLRESKLAMDTYASQTANLTHPARSDRLQAIAVGWSNAKHLDENADEKIPNETEKISTPPPRSETIEIDDLLDDEDNTTTRVSFQYLGNAVFPINSNVEINLNGIWYTPPGNSFYVDNVPLGNNYYQISGTLSYNLYGLPINLPVNSNGYIMIGQSNTVYIIVDYDMIWDKFSIRLSNTNY